MVSFSCGDNDLDYNQRKQNSLFFSKCEIGLNCPSGIQTTKSVQPVCESPIIYSDRHLRSTHSIPNAFKRSNVQERVIFVPKVEYLQKIVELPRIEERQVFIDDVKKVVRQKIKYTPKIEYKEVVKYVENPVYKTKEIEVPNVNYEFKTVEVIKPIFKEKIQTIPILKEEVEIKYVPKIEKKIIEIPKIINKDVFVEKIVEKPIIKHVYEEKIVTSRGKKIYRSVPVDCVVDKIIPKYEVIEKPKTVGQKLKYIPKPVYKTVPKKNYVKVEKKIAQYITVPVKYDVYQEIPVNKVITKTVEKPTLINNEKVVYQKYEKIVPIEKIIYHQNPIRNIKEETVSVPVRAPPEPLIHTIYGLMPFSEYKRHNDDDILNISPRINQDYPIESCCTYDKYLKNEKNKNYNYPPYAVNQTNNQYINHENFGTKKGLEWCSCNNFQDTGFNNDFNEISSHYEFNQPRIITGYGNYQLPPVNYEYNESMRAVKDAGKVIAESAYNFLTNIVDGSKKVFRSLNDFYN